MNIDITPIVKAAIILMSAIITSVVVPLLKKKLSAEKVSEIQMWVKIAVHAAEQIFSDTGMGKQKKEYVLKFLRERGFDVDDQAIENAIEAAVYDMNNAFADVIVENTVEGEDIPYKEVE